MTNQSWLNVQSALPTNLKRSPMSTDTRDKILQAAFTVLSRQGYENASIKEIA